MVDTLVRLVEIPAYVFAMFAIDRIGRKPTLYGCLFSTGINCLVTGLLPIGKSILLSIIFYVFMYTYLN